MHQENSFPKVHFNILIMRLDPTPWATRLLFIAFLALLKKPFSRKTCRPGPTVPNSSYATASTRSGTLLIYRCDHKRRQIPWRQGINIISDPCFFNPICITDDICHVIWIQCSPKSAAATAQSNLRATLYLCGILLGAERLIYSYPVKGSICHMS